MPSSAVVLDTNVLVAAGFNPRSASAKQGQVRMVWNDATRREMVLSQILRDDRESPAGIGVRRPGSRIVRLV
jgi:hypothetical protein